jgi:hypothetical protein
LLLRLGKWLKNCRVVGEEGEMRRGGEREMGKEVKREEWGRLCPPLEGVGGGSWYA